MKQVPPDIARKLLSRDFTNLVGRVQKGGKLTRAERSMLQSMAAGAGRDPATVASYVELGAVLGVTRQTLHAWKKRKDAPKPASNGLHEVAAWREFMRRHDLKGGEQPAGDADMESARKARKLLAEVEKRELRLGIRRGDFVSVASVRQSWSELVAQAASMLRRKFEQELPPILSGLDATGIQEEARRASKAEEPTKRTDAPDAAVRSLDPGHDGRIGKILPQAQLPMVTACRPGSAAVARPRGMANRGTVAAGACARRIGSLRVSCRKRRERGAAKQKPDISLT